MQQDSQLAEEGETESPSIKSLPGESFSRLSGKDDGSGEKSLPDRSETRRARPKGTCKFCYLLFSINPFVLKLGFSGLFTDCYILFCGDIHYGNLVLSALLALD